MPGSIPVVESWSCLRDPGIRAASALLAVLGPVPAPADCSLRRNHDLEELVGHVDLSTIRHTVHVSTWITASISTMRMKVVISISMHDGQPRELGKTLDSLLEPDDRF